MLWITSTHGYFPNEKPVITEKETGETIVSIGVDTLDELIVEENGILKIKIGIVYFDMNKSFIRNYAAIELNKILFLMNRYPTIEIKIESHTDSRSPDGYNLSLSDKRVKATRDYLISKGVEARRIESATGYGETKLINECKNRVLCSEIRHQQNRRSEFIIVKI